MYLFLLIVELKKLEKVKGKVTFKNVDFHYPTRPNVAVLDQCNLTARPGKVVALVGPSGSGKSSVMLLLERFYNVAAGKILLDGHDISKMNPKWLRQQIGIVSQEPVLFAGTIADNIAYGKDGATQEEIEAAATAANAHKFIMKFPDGYKTDVGEKGAQLSGGQKQRIAIARGILKNPKILLLDEATSALDTESEKVVQKALDKVMKGRTTIVIAHRLSTIKDADLICVLQNGKIVESGNHTQLMANQGVYAELVARQAS